MDFDGGPAVAERDPDCTAVVEEMDRETDSDVDENCKGPDEGETQA